MSFLSISYLRALAALQSLQIKSKVVVEANEVPSDLSPQQARGTLVAHHITITVFIYFVTINCTANSLKLSSALCI